MCTIDLVLSTYSIKSDLPKATAVSHSHNSSHPELLSLIDLCLNNFQTHFSFYVLFKFKYIFTNT